MNKWVFRKAKALISEIYAWTYSDIEKTVELKKGVLDLIMNPTSGMTSSIVNLGKFG